MPYFGGAGAAGIQIDQSQIATAGDQLSSSLILLPTAEAGWRFTAWGQISAGGGQNFTGATANLNGNNGSFNNNYLIFTSAAGMGSIFTTGIVLWNPATDILSLGCVIWSGFNAANAAFTNDQMRQGNVTALGATGFTLTWDWNATTPANIESSLVIERLF